MISFTAADILKDISVMRNIEMRGREGHASCFLTRGLKFHTRLGHGKAGFLSVCVPRYFKPKFYPLVFVIPDGLISPRIMLPCIQKNISLYNLLIPSPA